MHQPFTISRLLKAPRALVWEVYSQAEHLANWLGPKGSTISHSALDFREGGSYLYSMKVGDTDLWGKWLIREIKAPEKIVVIQHFSDPQGGTTRNPWNPEWPMRTLATTTLTEVDGGTLLNIEWQPYEASAAEEDVFAAAHASMNDGWSGNLDVLEDYLSLLSSKV